LRIVHIKKKIQTNNFFLIPLPCASNINSNDIWNMETTTSEIKPLLHQIWITSNLNRKHISTSGRHTNQEMDTKQQMPNTQ
jgi:hypothetical protein